VAGISCLLVGDELASTESTFAFPATVDWPMMPIIDVHTHMLISRL
jgi:hypothetical protein